MKPLMCVVALSVSLVACTPPGGGGDTVANDLDTAPDKTTVLRVTIIPARQGTLTVQRSASAIITAQRDSQVATQSGGTVMRVLADEGEQVSAGQVVVQLDDTVPRQALENARLQVQQAEITLQQTRDTTSQAGSPLQSAVQSAQATLAQAQQGAQSAESLYKLGGISLSDLQSARATLAQAQSGLAAARNNLEQNGRSAQGSVPLQQAQLRSAQASVRQAEENLARTGVKAPFAGMVASISAREGEFAAQGTPVFRLVDPGSIRAKFNVPSSDASTLTGGTRLNLGYGGVNYVAVVQGSPGIAGGDRLVPITARVQGGEQLPVGAAAQVRYRASLGQGVLVPSSAVRVEGGENAVFIAAGGRAERRVVSVVAESGGQLAVTGVQAGEAVINPLPTSLQDGAGVRVDTAPDSTSAPESTSPAPPEGQAP
ncbi:efflux RND transporter periplasmic adaptor subunit [Deinococcus aerophilus]|uniref:Efflux RND transporter periplasmic adaptor subunit n=1 Tax=Deinococcus aerophilus TaxID=522488 RepID=A0ABQ2GK51_9DEIO|nr:efflux RND transporter periplasmic adaptor subunit [Deinococcus aerophilus]GGL99055.1 hypothetical protein GCM10010841_04470 [Deinococcus aerophilus]